MGRAAPARRDAGLVLQGLDELGPQAWSVVLPADHGVVPVEDSLKRPACGPSPKPALDTGIVQRLGGAWRAHPRRGPAERGRERGDKPACGCDGKKAREDHCRRRLSLHLLDRSRESGDHARRLGARRLASRLDGELRRKLKSVHAVLDSPIQGSHRLPRRAQRTASRLWCAIR